MTLFHEFGACRARSLASLLLFLGTLPEFDCARLGVSSLDLGPDVSAFGPPFMGELA